MATDDRPMVIGIAGGTGSGKTTIVNVILERVGSGALSFLPHDAYYKDRALLPASLREHVNFDHPEALETALLIRHLAELRQGLAVETPVYDFTNHVRTEKTRRVEPRPVILVDGILILAVRELRELFDMRIFVDTPADIRLIRRLNRDISVRGRSLESVIRQYETTVRPMHEEFVAPSRRYADVIIPEGGHNTVALEMVLARIESLLARGLTRRAGE